MHVLWPGRAMAPTMSRVHMQRCLGRLLLLLSTACSKVPDAAASHGARTHTLAELHLAVTTMRYLKWQRAVQVMSQHMQHYG